MNTTAQTQPKIPIPFALANCYGVSSEEVYTYISEHLSESHLFTLRPGDGRKAAFDAVIVLGSIAAIATIAQVLWAAYDRFIAPTKANTNDSSGIYISVPQIDGTRVEIWLGRDVYTQDQFKNGFELVIESAKRPEMEDFNRITVEEIESSDDWDKR